MKLEARHAVWALSAALLASFGVSAALARAALRYFKDTEVIRLDPAGISAYAGSRTASPGDLPVAVFFGDSRAFMWSMPTAPTGYRMVNRGVSYQTTAQMLLRFDVDVAPLHPSVVIFEGGVNDLKAIASFPQRRAEIVSECESDLTNIVERSRSAGAIVVLVSIFDIGDVALWRQPFWSSDVAAAVREVNAFLQKLANERVFLFDAAQFLDDDQQRIRPAYQLDFLHLTPAGYDALNAQLVPFLATLPK